MKWKSNASNGASTIREWPASACQSALHPCWQTGSQWLVPRFNLYHVVELFENVVVFSLFSILFFVLLSARYFQRVLFGRRTLLLDGNRRDRHNWLNNLLSFGILLSRKLRLKNLPFILALV